MGSKVPRVRYGWMCSTSFHWETGNRSVVVYESETSHDVRDDCESIAVRVRIEEVLSDD